MIGRILALLAAQAAAGIHYQQGVDLFQKGRPDEARVYLKRAVEQEPSARHWKALGVLEASVGRYAEAEPALRELFHGKPGLSNQRPKGSFGQFFMVGNGEASVRGIAVSKNDVAPVLLNCLAA